MKKKYFIFLENNLQKVVFGSLLLLSSVGYSQVTKTVGVSGADYTTLKAAFDAVNAGSITGAITLQVIDNTTETASAVLNASGTGSASYSSLTIYPTVAGISISGNVDAPLIELNGADNVVVDGRINATGTTKDLTISNTSIVATAGTSTIRLINDATLNTIKYAVIKGSTLDVTGGIINFSTTTGTTGNDNNTIDNNAITSVSDATRPINTIYSLGTALKGNDNNSVTNNNVYDFLNKGLSSYGLKIGTDSSAWTISGNSFYETTAFVTNGATTGYDNYIINITNTSGNGFTVSNNYIGGSAAQCGGAYWTKTDPTSRNAGLYGIYISVGQTSLSNVQGNTLSNFDWSASGNRSFSGIVCVAGNLEVSNNTIGSATITDAIKLSHSNGRSDLIGVASASGTGIVTIKNNTIANITTRNTSGIIGINKSGASTTVSIKDNIIKNILLSQNVSGTNTVPYLHGISITNGTAIGAYGVTGNSITNLRSNSPTYGDLSVTGIRSNKPSVITNNIINGLISNSNVGANLVGISITDSTTSSSVVSANVITNLENVSTNATAATAILEVIGIYNTSTKDIVCSGNFINNLTVNAATPYSLISGIKATVVAIGSTYSNNIISIGGTTDNVISGFSLPVSTVANKLYFNTVNINGASSGVNNTYALYDTRTLTTMGDYRNNLFVNTRTNSSTESQRKPQCLQTHSFY